MSDAVDEEVPATASSCAPIPAYVEVVTRHLPTYDLCGSDAIPLTAQQHISLTAADEDGQLCQVAARLLGDRSTGRARSHNTHGLLLLRRQRWLCQVAARLEGAGPLQL